MATGIKVNGVEIDTIFIWNTTYLQTDDTTRFKGLPGGIDISRYMFNASTNSYSSGLYKAGTDIGTLYCTTGCNASCNTTCALNGCTDCTSVCTDNGCTDCTSVCTDNGCSTICGVDGCTSNCTGGCDGIF